jgi:hypothetical protein
MRVALHTAILRKHCRIALDKPIKGEPGERAILQFPVCPYLFDAFFNARCGYRANYWAAPNFGIQSERALVSLLAQLLGNLPPHLRARKIELHAGATRLEEDVGFCNVATAFLAASLSSNLSKLWICERPLRSTKGALDDVIQSFRDEALRLNVPRWAKAQAILPEPQLCWIDWKGAFVDGVRHFQPKLPEARAASLYKTGWT